MISARPSASSQSRRTIVFYVRHCHRYCYELPTVSDSSLEPEEPADPGPSPASTPPSSDSEDELGSQIGGYVSQHRDEFHLCPHNFLGYRNSTPEHISFIRGLPHHQRDCRPCEDCLDVCFRHDHPCPPIVLAGARSALDNYCNIGCTPYGSYSRPSPLEFRVLHNCPWSSSELDPLIESARRVDRHSTASNLSGRAHDVLQGQLPSRSLDLGSQLGYPRVPFDKSLQVGVVNLFSLLFFFLCSRMKTDLRGYSVSVRGVSKLVPYNCLGGQRPAVYKSKDPEGFESALKCPRVLNPAPPPLPGADRPCNCIRCRDWVFREGRHLQERPPLLGTSFGLRPRAVLEEAARDGLQWYLLSYWDCPNLDWVPAYLRPTISEWPDSVPEHHKTAPRSVTRVPTPVHWIWSVLDQLVKMS